MSRLNDRQFSRRSALRAGAVGGAAMATGLAVGGSTRAQDAEFDWKQFEGEEITVLLATSPRADILTDNQAEFEELTGIKVNADVVPEQQQRQKQVIEFTSGNPTFDVTLVSWHVQKSLFHKGNWMLDLREYLEDPTMTAPDYDFDDFSAASRNFATQKDGVLDTLPFNIDYWILYWNKELFEAAGVAFPETLDEVVEAAAAIHDPDNNVYGFAARGIKNANTPVWTSFMQGWEVEPIGADNEMNTATDAAVAAAEYYQNLMANYAPPGAISFNWNECQSLFALGQAAMWFDGIGFATPLEDPETSQVVGKVGYGLQPGGPVARHSGTFGDGIGVTAGSKNPGPAYYYCQWATGQANQARILAQGAGAPARQSAYSNEEALANLIVPQEWVDTLIASGEIGLPSLPEIIPVTEFRDVFGVALTNMITGADPREELEKATAEFQPILDESLQ